jgi:hypothetical protein
LTGREERGQVLVIVALALVVLLGASAFTIDLGRRAAEERYLQNAADAGALAGCNARLDGASDAAVIARAREVATTNLAGSPGGSGATIAATGAEVYLDGYHGVPEQLLNGVLVDGPNVRVAIDSTIGTTIGKVLGRESLPAVGRAHCTLEPQPLLPFIARRYQSPPGPGTAFIDHLATDATSRSGAVDPTNPRGYGGRTPASELAPGPEFELFGPQSQATNSSFRGFIALDVRDFTHATSRKYFNGATATMSSNVLKNHHAAYIENGYPGPDFPAVETPPTGDTQVGVMNGTTNAQTTQPFDSAYSDGDRLLLSIYDGTVMAIPDFAIQPPTSMPLPANTATPVAGASFEVSRNNAFTSTVTFSLRGDTGAAATGHAEYNLLADPPVSPPATGKMSEPTFTPNTFVPAQNGTSVSMGSILTTDVPPGIYAVWLEGQAGAPYSQIRRQPFPVRIGSVPRQFRIEGPVDGTIDAIGGSTSLPLRIVTDGPGATAWTGGSSTATPVDVSWDATSLTTCSHAPVAWGAPTISFNGMASASVAPSSGTGTAVDMAIHSGSLASGCYLFTLRAQGVNSDGQPVVRLRQVQFSVAATTGPNEYVDITGFAVFEISGIDANAIYARAITGIYADPNDFALRAAQRPRLIPWS